MARTVVVTFVGKISPQTQQFIEYVESTGAVIKYVELPDTVSGTRPSNHVGIRGSGSHSSDY